MRSSLRPVFRASILVTILLLGVALFLGGCTKEKPQTRSATPGATLSAALAATTVVTVPTAELGGELLPTLTPTIPATTIATQPTATPESDFSELAESSVDATATAIMATAMAETEPTPTSVPVLTPLADATPTPFSIEPAPTSEPEWQPEEPSDYAAPQAPAGTTYVVHWGDTLYSIAVQFDVSIEDIMAVNGLSSDLIVIGQELIIPGGGGMPPGPGGETVHIVQPGETLFSIGLTYNTTWQAIAQANGIANPWFIYVGQKLVIPGGGDGPVPPAPSSTYVVQPGDTLYTIAMRFNTTIQTLMVVNNLSNPNMIYVGQVLRIQ